MGYLHTRVYPNKSLRSFKCTSMAQDNPLDMISMPLIKD